MPTSLYYMSFCDPDRPSGSQFLGASIVAAASLPEALTVSHLLGCNPGGEVEAAPVPQNVRIKASHINRLLTAAEAEEACDSDTERAGA